MSSNVCKNCGKENEEDFKFCAYCGEKLSYLVCPKCGKEYNEDYNFCGKCGEKLVEKNTKIILNEEVYYLNFQNGECTAKGIKTNNGFVVLKGAKIRKSLVKSASKSLRDLRRLHKSKIKDFIITEDILFSSASSAASFIIGGAASGRIYWIPEKKYIKDQSQSINTDKPSTNNDKSISTNNNHNKYSINNDKSISANNNHNKYSINNDKIFYLKSDDYYGEGTYDGEVFTLLKGAKLNKFLEPYAEKKVLNYRKRNRSRINNFTTIDNIKFNSPSSAAIFISGTVINGRKEWKNKNGKSINDIYRE